ncbi:cell wall-binding repeat-containing protein [Herbiconiux ginsengi]|uniref:Putative cell wall binding repeat 2 n=1 Tax=Herbiconiux ginsengi TaxID=381665 RepID=A0A1H3QR99_9MICO|nr:cell wall-binding repeat-containing protein [Herbiconiux ginsengi]SDZ15927.1 Putative cell wall binding repeat 2 [Herbiconiux ginsengi]
MTRIRSAITATIMAIGLVAGSVAVSTSSAAASDSATHAISGHVANLSPAGQNSFGVSAHILVFDENGNYAQWGDADWKGNYRLEGLKDGDYRIQFTEYHSPYSADDVGLAPTWWGDTPFRSEAKVLTIDGADEVADVGMVAGASIKGVVDTTAWYSDNVQRATTYIQNPDGSWERGAEATVTNGSYFMIGVPAAPQVILFSDYTNGIGGGRMYSPQYWPNQPTRSTAKVIQPAPGDQLTGYNATLLPWAARAVQRISGADRFEASANISASHFSAGVPVVFVADGTNYPDALSAGPVAAHLGGPVLLVTPGDVPAPIASELNRLKPQKIYVVGGPNSVNNSTYSRLAQFAPQIERIGGTDRYEVSRKLALLAAPAITPDPTSGESRIQVLFADGRGFADALSAGSAAASGGGVVVLVNGANSKLDAPTTALIHQLQPESAWVIGGPNSMSPALDDNIRSLGVGFNRIAGATRYDVSAELGDYFVGWGEDSNAYLALGSNFPDALSGAALAGATDAILFITPSDCVPGRVLDRMKTSGTPNAILLGGPNSLGAGVEQMRRC